MADFKIDSITWNDLNMDEVYNRINFASSSVGEDYLRDVLSRLVYDEDILKARNDRIKYFEGNPEKIKSIQKIFGNLGKTKKYKFIDYIFRINEVPNQSNAKHILLIILLLISISLIFVNPAIGIIALIIMIAVNIILYFRFKEKIEGYFNCIKYLVRMNTAAQKIVKEGLGEEFDGDIQKLKEAVRIFSKERRGSWLITNSVSGSLVDVILDYVRMIFHVDIIKFNNMKKHAGEHSDDIRMLYKTLGEIEVAVCVCLFRKDKKYCIPEFALEYTEKRQLKFTNVYHTLVRRQPVGNSLDIKKSVLLTGSNASGKSTFLKAVAISQILSQTIYTALADEYKTGFYKVISSMALADNILANESYFVVEIKSLKRIFDEIDDTDGLPVMVFIDEVLRGTNTKERIAASSQILMNLSGKNAVVFAATHDIELTEILKPYMDNYHFSEKVADDKVLFDYNIKKGPADTSNAIKLLKAYGFDASIVKNAENMIK